MPSTNVSQTSTTVRPKADPPRSQEDDIRSVLKKAADDPDFPFRIVIASRPEYASSSFSPMAQTP
jgi:hypothetical protein